MLNQFHLFPVLPRKRAVSTYRFFYQNFMKEIEMVNLLLFFA